MQGTGFMGRLEDRWARRQDEQAELLSEVFQAQSEVWISASRQGVWDLVEAPGVEAMVLSGNRVKLLTVPSATATPGDRPVFLFRTTDQGQLAVLESDVVSHLPPSLSVRTSRTPIATTERHELTDEAGGCRYVVSLEAKVPRGFTLKVDGKLHLALDEFLAGIKTLVEASAGYGLPVGDNA